MPAGILLPSPTFPPHPVSSFRASSPVVLFSEGPAFDGSSSFARRRLNVKEHVPSRHRRRRERLWCWVVGLLVAGVLARAAGGPAAQAQRTYDASWYDGDAPYVKIAVTEDGVHRVSGEDLEAAGVPLDRIDPSTLRLLEKGREIPLRVQDSDGALSGGDGLVFVGRRNRGADEAWAYNYQPRRQSSAYRSLYTDTLTYWLTWGGEAGRRYQPASGSGGGGTLTRTVRDTLHRERDRTYHFGPSSRTGGPLFSRGEGYYGDGLSDSATTTYDLALPRASSGEDEELRLAVRLVGRTGGDGGTNSCHRAALEADFGSGFEPLAETQWVNYNLATVEARVSQSRLNSSDSVDVRVRTFDDGFDELSSCRSGSNEVALDYVEAGYTRRLAPAASDGQQHITAPAGAARTYQLAGYDGGAQISVLSPATGRRRTLRAGSDGRARFDVSADARSLWVTAGDRYRSPADVSYQPAGSAPDWTASARAADYVVLTTDFLRSSAEELAAYRQAQDGYATAVVTVDEVYDQFDYGRATPIAIRRFIHYMERAWDTPARFVTFWGDSTYPIRTNTAQPDAPWNVPAFGFAPSDAWYAMQYDGPNDWSEVVALGRVPVRTAAQAATFLDKLEGYESAPLRDWQKRYLALSGGSSDFQQRQLETFNTGWAHTAGAPPTGMDTIYFSKKSDETLEYGFQDSLNAAFQRGAGWLNYFGHSAAQTWEIVTAKPIDFDNAGRLPFVVSLGCQTGAFAGGRYSEKPAPSFGEQLVLGMNPDQPRGPGSRNGAIAHFGTSYLGRIGTSATLNDALIASVYRDTMRAMGAAVQQAKARIAADDVTRYMRNHLMQYNLLGEAAARLQIPDRPNLHLAPSQIEARPLAPVPSDSLRMAVTIKAQGLVPGRPAPEDDGDPFDEDTPLLADSTVALDVAQRLPGGETLRRTDTLDAFAVDTTVHYSFFLKENAVGQNTLRAETDYVDHPLAERPEARASDNRTETEKNVFASGLRIVAPRDHGTLPTENPLLRLSPSSAAGEGRSVRLQLATDSAFTDVRAEATREATGPLIKWAPPVSLEAGRTYYWRARLDPRDERIWRTGSFTAQPRAPAGGWLQQDGQFSVPARSNLRRRSDQWAFDTFEAPLQVFSDRGNAASVSGFRLAGAQNFVYLAFGIGVLIMDGETAQVKAATTFCPADVADKRVDPSGSMGCDGDEGEAAIDRLQTLIETTLDEGDYLFTRTRALVLPNRSFAPEVQRVFRCLGTEPCGSSGAGSVYSQAADTLGYDDLWIMKARKGYPDQTEEKVDPSGSGNSNMDYQTRVPFNHARGQVTTARIGPAQDWGAVTWQARTGSAGDRLTLEVLGGNGDTVLREATLAPGDGSPPEISLDGLGAPAHPYLRLRATLEDSTDRTVPQLDQWHVSYTPTAELAIDRAHLKVAPSDTLDEGQPARVHVPIVNLSRIASDPVRTRIALTDSSNQQRTLATDTLAALAPDSTRTIEAPLETASLVGVNTLTMQARQWWSPTPPNGPGEVPERLASNNSAVRTFLVRGDRTAPEVQVNVDGRTLPIAREESPTNPQGPEVPFVPLNPTFEIILSDNSEYLTLDDKDFIEVRFGPSSSFERPVVPFSDEDLEFLPAEKGGQPARALFSPSLDASSLRDTTYTLEVEVQDTKGNEPETTYRTHVRVKTEVAVEDLYPYPNPMSTHTDFMFRLQGSDVSAIRECRMRIYTLGGQMLMEMDMMENPMLVNPDEGGGLKTGWNRVPWEGRDADGDRLPTGVYLYKVHMEGEGDLDVNDGNVEKIAIIR